MRLYDTINRETQKIYQKLKRDFPDYARATILICFHPQHQTRLGHVNQKIAHDLTVMKKVEGLPVENVYIFASHVILKTDLQVVNLAWLHEGSVVTKPEYGKYSATVGVKVK